MKHLHHKGVLVPNPYEGVGLVIKVRGEDIELIPEQEELALSWAKKIGTDYTEDPVFAKNFHIDLSKKLGKIVELCDVDYSEVLEFVERERLWKANLTREEKKELSAQRKEKRELNKQHYGYAFVDSVKMGIANYTVEPNSIFLGRGKHPLRGRWKEGPKENDIELNLSPDAPKVSGKWRETVWDPDVMWVARWKDKLTGKMKYVWISDSSILRQKKDIEKFDKAKDLKKNIRRIQRHIKKSLDSHDIKRRKIATVCYLIEKLKIRVGDEKDPDEADTVGASTLRPEHIKFIGDGTVTLNFLGKDSIPQTLTTKIPENIIQNLKDFSLNAEPTLFEGIGSKHVSEFLDEIMTGLSAKVFRTYYSSEAVEKKLLKTPVEKDDEEFVKKYVATISNLEAAKICNHRRKKPKSWESSLNKKKIRLKDLSSRLKNVKKQYNVKVNERIEKYDAKRRKKKERIQAIKIKRENYQSQLKKAQKKSVPTLKKRIKRQDELLTRQRLLIKKLRNDHKTQMEKLRQRFYAKRQRNETAINKLKLKLKIQKKTRDYNLTTSLKSYIDPRIYYNWSEKIDYDWKKYYPKTLQSKFSWIEKT
jgi:DNA topoisomerase-1